MIPSFRRGIGRACGLIVGLAAILLLGTARPADAFCGFYVSGADTKLFNNATQVVLLRDGLRTVLSMQNNYQGPAASFALVVPVPVVLQKENVKTLPREIFAKIDELDAPRLVEYWEQDPCYEEKVTEDRPGAVQYAPASPGNADGANAHGVKVEAKFAVGEYEVVILSAKDATGLDAWLRQEKYAIPPGSEPLFRPYIAAGSKFFVAKVDITKVKLENGMATLSPLRFHYDSEQFALPVRLGLASSNGTQDLIVHILSTTGRYEVANYPNVTIPTNLDVSEAARAKFGSFYAALFDATVAKTKNAVVTEYSWDASTCDPCPGPALFEEDFALLGADVIPPKNSHFYGPFTITRLHARYAKESLGEDLVFRTAPAITGGREVMSSAKTLEHGSAPASGTNNFQARYAIRHPWGGPVACKDPRRGIWGGPPVDPSGHVPDSSTKAAKDLAFVPRDVKLASYVRTDIPELGVASSGDAVSPVIPLGKDGKPLAKASGCLGCTAVGRGDGSGDAALLAAAGLAVVVVRRRRRTAR